MIKQIVLIGILIFLTSSQTTVIPKTQRCDCINILNQQDCYSQQDCIWTIIQMNNSDSSNNTTPTGLCKYFNTSTSNVSSTNPVNQCSIISNQTICSKTIGCAFFNNSCILFSGCTAYIQTTNSQCQTISNQCTTDGTRCVDPSPCQSYNSSSLCSDNIATSGAKTCKWIEAGSQSSCIDKVCSDAPNTFNTDLLCNGWIVGCLSTGQGCASTLKSCSTYLQVAGCTGMIGSDGPCIANTDQGSTVCRSLACTDAPNTLTTNTDCSKFLQGCLTTGKGCVKILQSCSSYQQSQGCSSLIGSEGSCTIDTTNTTNCRALTCNDAPSNINTNSGCNQFLNNCITTGQGCIKTLGQCSSYIGNESQCNLYIGSDGNCKGTGSSSQVCSVRTCNDAPKSINTDLGCSTYQKGCITNGAGCVIVLQLCQQYTGTATTCLLYKGSDGNCTAPSSQTTDGPCIVKVCSNALENNTSNSGCQQFSYKCVTNGIGCIEQPVCETTQYAITCEGNSACSYNQICLDRSSCVNYYNQSLCALNQQQYKLGSKIYLRKCQWTNSCQNTLCSSLPTTLKTDSDCDNALSGCITNGNGCVDMNDNCSSYQGLISTCQGYKGLNGQQTCTQLITVTNASTPCVALTQCQQAKQYSQITQTSDKTCDTFLKGCLFNGYDNCTNGDCNTYSGNLAFCSNLGTAISSNKNQKCWKVNDPTNSATQCIPRTCAHATVTIYEPFNTDALCQGFLQNCVWNGKSSGGCQDSSTSCTNYVGTLAQCNVFSQQRCTKTSGFCQSSISPCNASKVDASLTLEDQQKFCQKILDPSGYNCFYYGYGDTCILPTSFDFNFNAVCKYFIPSGQTDEEKNAFCQNMKIPGSLKCSYNTGESNCNLVSCDSITAEGDSPDTKAAFCTSKMGYYWSKLYTCALKASTDTKCSIPTCPSYSNKTKALCQLQDCGWNDFAQKCYTKAYCYNNFPIPAEYQSDLILKAKYCGGFKSLNTQQPCTYATINGNEKVCQGENNYCTVFTFPQTIATEVKLQICLNQVTQSGVQCVLRTGQYTCADFSCDLYLIVEDLTDIELQEYCLLQKTPCGYDDLSKTTCKSYSTCEEYKTYGADDVANKAFCAKYKANGFPCVYSSGATCKTFDCSEVSSGQSVATCQAYYSQCYFNGEECIGPQTNCSDYTAKSSGAGEFVNCSNLSKKSGAKCGYSSGSTCKDRGCADIISGGSDSICSAYISNCVFNGNGCQISGLCNTYTAVGSSNSEKSQFCKTRVSTEGKCTYLAGSNKCSAAQDSCSTYQISGFTGATPSDGCSLLVDKSGTSCLYLNGQNCSYLSCDGAPSNVSTDSDCQNFRAGCSLATTTQCADKLCSDAPKSSVTDTACATYRFGCITNGAGCIEANSNCSDFKGTAATCASFKANNGTQLCGNSISATATNSCSNRNCQQNTTAKNDQDCDLWIPSTTNTKNCVWNGTNGCVTPQYCSAFQGTIDTCPKFTALDGPCLGFNSSIAACATKGCLNAPSTFNTDSQCKQWGPNCMTNGSGCIQITQCQSIGSPQGCQEYKNSLGCDLAKQCRTKPQQCSDFNNPSECNNIPITGLTLPGCGWNMKTNTCGLLTCINLPFTLTTDQQCSQSISNCTTNGSGCVTKGACSTYNKQACGIATTTDVQRACIWSNQACRPIQCTDNNTATSDAACDTYLVGCKTTGSGCVQSLTCPQFTVGSLCVKDSNGNPCLWLKTQQNQNGSCVKYTQCTDIISNSHQDCQNASPYCTTNGTNCIAITSCSKTISQSSCFIGTDGNCGWLPASGSNSGTCTLFTNCTAAKGTTTQQCQAWGKQCISDGVSCLLISTCSSYQSQQACQNQGTDGKCFWEAQSQSNQGICRLQQCTDSITNNSTHSGCSQFLANTPCTTSGTGCIPLGKCQSYKAETGCVIGTDGQCFWQTSLTNTTDSSVCRLKQCTDNILTTSSACLNSIAGIKCVSNGVNCILQTTCQTYNTREGCFGGGTDGQCAFTPNSNSDQQNGKCRLFSRCEDANQDQTTCSLRQDSCYFNSTTINGTTTTICQPHTCQTKGQASYCQPIPSFDLQSYQICVLTGSTCSLGSPSQLSQTNCFQNSAQTYSWNPNTQSCNACKGSNQINNENNQSNQTRSNTYGYLIGIYILIALWSV